MSPGQQMFVAEIIVGQQTFSEAIQTSVWVAMNPLGRVRYLGSYSEMSRISIGEMREDVVDAW
jgi:hypothetical protein